MLAHAAGDLAALERDSNRSAELFAEIGDRWGRLQAADWVGGRYELIGEYDRAIEVYREGLRWAEELTLWPEVGGKLAWLAWISVQTRDYPQARELGERAYRLACEQGAESARVFAQLSLGFAARRAGKLDLAGTHLHDLLATARREDQPPLYLPMVLTELGYVAELTGDPAAAVAWHLEAFDVVQAMGAPRDAIGALYGLASATADPAVGARLLGAARAARSATEFAASPADLDDLDRITARLVAALGRDRFDDLVAEGAELSPGEARALV